MINLWLVTPVHGRPERTALCLEQRARLLDELRAGGLDAGCVVVGDGGALGVARDLGMTVLSRPNVLGMKINDGIEWACRERGADFVSYAGSDEWLLANYFADPDPGTIRTGSWYAAVTPEGDAMVMHHAIRGDGIAPWIIPRSLLEPVAFRPAQDELMRGLDGSIRRGIAAPMVAARRDAKRRKVRPAPRGPLFRAHDIDQLQHVGLRGRLQVTETLPPVHRRKHQRRRTWIESDPWSLLATRYPSELVERARVLYAKGVPA